MNSKTCRHCGNHHAATSEFFYRNSRECDGLSRWCKACLDAACVTSRNKRASRGRDDGPIPPTLACLTCHEELPFTHEFFMRDKHQPFGLYKRCRKCTNQERADHRKRQPTGSDKTRKEWSNKKESNKLRYNQDPIPERARRLFNGIVSRCRDKNLVMDGQISRALIESLLKTRKACPCCNTTFDLTFHMDGRSHRSAPSIDRLRPDLGYTMENIRLVCWRCNEIKGDSTSAELRMVAEWMDS